jgi:hypothetical protein
MNDMISDDFNTNNMIFDGFAGEEMSGSTRKQEHRQLEDLDGEL